MKKSRGEIFILFPVLLFLSSAQSQVDVVKFSKVQVGMSTSEVKTILGRPKAIEMGFPTSWNGLEPDMSGQLNYTSWFYFTTPLQHVVTTYKLNDREVGDGLFLRLQNTDTLIFEGGTPIIPQPGWHPSGEYFIDGYLSELEFYHSSPECSLLGEEKKPVRISEGDAAVLKPCPNCVKYTVEFKDEETSGYFKTQYVLSNVLVVTFERGTSLVADKAQHSHLDSTTVRLR
jgi:hypothetical protein